MTGVPTTDARAPVPLRALAFATFFFPASMVIRPLGALGTVAFTIACAIFGLWAVSCLLGLHNPLDSRHPGRIGVVLLILASMTSYVAMFSGWTGGSTGTSRAAADRFLILLLASAGVIFWSAERIRSVAVALSQSRALLAGAAFCAAVALVQFYAHVDPVTWIKHLMPGFTYNGGDTTYQARGVFLRVAGTTFHSIELAVVSAMLLPLAIWRALFDPAGRKWAHWLTAALLVFAVASTISRSGVLSIVVAGAVFAPFLPRVARRWALPVVVGVVAGFFLLIPGLVSTLWTALTAGNTDPSISTRTNNFPRVEALVSEHPLFGLGPGNYVADTAIHIFDNQYFGSAVTMGIVGVVGTLAYLAIPAIAALQAARTAVDPSLRCLAGAVAGGCSVATVASFTFDSLSFPTFCLTYALLVGLQGAVWSMVRREYYELGETERQHAAGDRRVKEAPWTP